MTGADDKLDARILAELAKEEGTLLELAIRLGVDTAALLRRLQVLGSLKRVQCARDEDSGRLMWGLIDADGDWEPDSPPEHAPPAAVVPPSPPTLTARVELFAVEHGPVTPAQVADAFPEAKATSVAAILGQLFTARRLCRERRAGSSTYAYGTPSQMREAPQKPRIFMRKGWWLCVCDGRLFAGETPRMAYENAHRAGVQ